MRSRSRRHTAGALALTGLALGALAAVGRTLLRRPPVGNPNVPEPAKPVDLQRYLGRWYELGRYEAPFQRGCEAVTADYSLRSDGQTITVRNACRKGSLAGPEDVSLGRARVVDASTRAKLEVSFFGPFWGDYWVLDRADDYTWAIVGEPSGRYLWILSRAAQPGEAAYQDLVDRARALGYDTSRIRRTRQPAG